MINNTDLQEGMQKIKDGVAQIIATTPAASTEQNTTSSSSTHIHSSSQHSFGSTIQNGVLVSSYDNFTASEPVVTHSINGEQSQEHTDLQ